MHVLREHAAQPRAVGVVEREDVEGGRLLFEAAPEQRRAQEEQHDDADSFLLDASSRPPNTSMYPKKPTAIATCVTNRPCASEVSEGVLSRPKSSHGADQQRDDDRGHQRPDALALLPAARGGAKPAVAEISLRHPELAAGR